MCLTSSSSLVVDVDDEYEDEDPWEEGAEDILEKGERVHAEQHPAMNAYPWQHVRATVDDDERRQNRVIPCGAIVDTGCFLLKTVSGIIKKMSL